MTLGLPQVVHPPRGKRMRRLLCGLDPTIEVYGVQYGYCREVARPRFYEETVSLVAASSGLVPRTVQLYP